MFCGNLSLREDFLREALLFQLGTGQDGLSLAHLERTLDID